MVFRLEYNKKTGGFHCESEENRYPRPENSYGWATLAKRVPDPLSMLFTEFVRRKYPILDKRGSGKLPSLTTIRKEFKAFKKTQQ
jgi:hypothetical protein